MDTRQYGPALFPTVKQVRRMLEEDHLPPLHTRRNDSSQSDQEDSRTGAGK
jgi:hypothetical protein